MGATPAAAQIAPGVQAGVGDEPDQFFAGVHVETRPFVDQLRFRPGVDFGFGDHVTLAAGNLDFVYRILFPRSSWALQVGGGPAINFYKLDRHSDVEGGFNVLLGVRHREGFFTELRVGMMDSPDLKFAIAYTFRSCGSQPKHLFATSLAPTRSATSVDAGGAGEEWWES